MAKPQWKLLDVTFLMYLGLHGSDLSLLCSALEVSPPPPTASCSLLRHAHCGVWLAHRLTVLMDTLKLTVIFGLRKGLT